MKPVKHSNITLSFPSDLNAILHAKVSRRGISQFVANAVRVALAEKEQQELAELEAAYKQANKDRDRQKTIAEWKALDNDEIENWEWNHD